jgi:hypothetical protein
MFKALHPVKLAQYVTTRYTKFRSRSPHTDTAFLPQSNRTVNLAMLTAKLNIYKVKKAKNKQTNKKTVSWNNAKL